MGRFDDKVAVVTGAGSGIGLATAAMLCSEGAKVLAVDLSFGPDRPRTQKRRIRPHVPM